MFAKSCEVNNYKELCKNAHVSRGIIEPVFELCSFLQVTCVVFLSIICTMFCFVSFVYLLADVNSDLSKLQDCTFSIRDKTCRCYVSDRAGRRLLKFSAVQSCLSVRKNLRSLVYGVSVLFGVGFIISMVTAIASSYLLYAEQRKSIQVYFSHTWSHVSHDTNHIVL